MAGPTPPLQQHLTAPILLAPLNSLLTVPSPALGFAFAGHVFREVLPIHTPLSNYFLFILQI